MSEVKEYIGDGIYVSYDQGIYTIYTSNGLLDENQIYFGDAEMDKLREFVDKVRRNAQNSPFSVDLGSI